jgi:hypothetical protein
MHLLPIVDLPVIPGPLSFACLQGSPSCLSVYYTLLWSVYLSTFLFHLSIQPAYSSCLSCLLILPILFLRSASQFSLSLSPILLPLYILFSSAFSKVISIT